MAVSAYANDSRAGRAMAEMNITPLVDVMLVLLIIFMVAAPMVTRTMELRLPQVHPDKPLVPPTRLTLGVQADGSYTLDGATLSPNALQASLASVARSAPETIVEISANADADYQAFAGALSAARNSGIVNIALQR